MLQEVSDALVRFPLEMSLMNIPTEFIEAGQEFRFHAL